MTKNNNTCRSTVPLPILNVSVAFEYRAPLNNVMPEGLAQKYSGLHNTPVYIRHRYTRTYLHQHLPFGHPIHVVGEHKATAQHLFLVQEHVAAPFVAQCVVQHVRVVWRLRVMGKLVDEHRRRAHAKHLHIVDLTRKVHRQSERAFDCTEF